MCFKLLQYTILRLLVASSQVVLASDCLAESVSDSWTLNGVEHSLSGRTVSGDRYDACYVQAKAVVDTGDISQPAEVKDKSFCLISYYYDRAVETKLIGSSFSLVFVDPSFYILHSLWLPNAWMVCQMYAFEIIVFALDREHVI